METVKHLTLLTQVCGNMGAFRLFLYSLLVIFMLKQFSCDYLLNCLSQYFAFGQQKPIPALFQCTTDKTTLDILMIFSEFPYFY